MPAGLRSGVRIPVYVVSDPPPAQASASHRLGRFDGAEGRQPTEGRRPADGSAGSRAAPAAHKKKRGRGYPRPPCALTGGVNDRNGVVTSP